MTFFSKVLFFGFLVVAYGCAITATRSVQEMSNAEAAIRAAKELHADSLAPELFRKASEYYFKAKRNYHLKNFEMAKKYAVRAMKLAEQAEFEAYKQGGATPEVSSKLTSPEGAPSDTEEALKNSQPSEQKESEALSTKPLPTEKKPQEEKGTDYNEYIRQQEEEAAKHEAGKAKPKEQETKPPGPSGQTGPSKLPVLLAQNSVVNQLPTLPQPVNKIDSKRWILEEATPPRKNSDISSLGETPIPDVESTGIPSLGHDALPETQGLDEMPTAPTQDAYRSEGIPGMYPEGEKK